MGDLPGPMKPLVGVTEETEPLDTSRPIGPAELMAEFRRLMETTGKRPDSGRRPGNVDGRATNTGLVNGRSGRHLGRRIRERHKMVVMLNVCGWTNKEIAKQMGYTEGRVSIILNSQRPELAAVKRDVTERVVNQTVDLTAKIRMKAGDALDRMIELVDSRDEKIAVRASADILDRAGYAPVRKQLHGHTMVPVEELSGVLHQIQDANEVDQNTEAWEVRTLPVDKKERSA